VIIETGTCELCDDPTIVPFDSDDDFAFCPMHAMALHTDASMDSFTIDIAELEHSNRRELRRGLVTQHTRCQYCGNDDAIPRHDLGWWHFAKVVNLCTRCAVSQWMVCLFSVDQWLEGFRAVK
jgi:hypothetical protein